jgi:hypothetical protein
MDHKVLERRHHSGIAEARSCGPLFTASPPYGDKFADYFNRSSIFSGVFSVHAADVCGRVTAMWLRIRRW